ncbi:MOSC domain-containing protein [Paenibacillus physcomitrellae]|uniref:MOSC domain-containing protein n=1 Tax=Paenibacillus physcomitrellae TaxID=1619311 RepID=A0ABQ1GKR7_9BACL|nr:MOSC domain-containing protein [Paenibacillus physcomitrellae]GGA45800.1 MOSC domain-containing protein [Paenibacillus physcomitrellae]
MSIDYAVASLNVGKPQPLKANAKEVMSGFNKQATEEQLYLSATQLQGDGQGDTVHHGGADKAVCVYCFKHYPFWEEKLGLTFKPGAFGENVTLHDLTEEEVRIGDIFKWGEAVVQVSQPRQPCYKIAAFHGVPELTVYVEQTGYTGFYLRVLEPGTVSQKDCLTLLEQAPQGITVAYANYIKYRSKTDKEGLERVLAVEALSDSWRSSLTKRLEKLG